MAETNEIPLRTSMQNGATPRGGIRLSPFPAASLPWLLDMLPWFPKFWWKPRGDSRPCAGAGWSADGQAVGLDAIETGRPIFGGRRFGSAGSPDSLWEEFPDFLFFSPGLYFQPSPDSADLVIPILFEEFPGAREILEPLTAAAGKIANRPNPAIARWDRPDFDGWAASVRLALERIRSGALEKVVLARESRFEFDQSPAPFQFLSLLASENPGGFHFALQPSKSSGTFLGASPELLYRRTGELLESEAVAGTRPRSMNPAEDERLEKQLLTHEKERREQGIVVEQLRESFEHLCHSFTCDATPSILKSPKVQHLQTGFRGTLRPGMTDQQILDILHPTPATCGRPTRGAAEFLSEVEGFDRGWYAGPVGFLPLGLNGPSEFCVAIRSMLLRDRMLHLFAGAGIVEGSDAEREWAELESKIASPLRSLCA